MYDLLKRVVSRLRRRSTRGMALGVRTPSIPGFRYNEVLRDEENVDESIRLLGWKHPIRWKAWDLLKTAHFVKEHVADRDARIMDAGCNSSPILEVLYTAGYRNLFGCDYEKTNLPKVPRLGFQRCDAASTSWPARHFRVVTCVSVIEHGVDLDRFLQEMARIIEPGGYLLLSTDYYDPKIDTSDVDRGMSMGLPWTIFSKAEIEDFVERGRKAGFEPHEPIRWDQGAALVGFWTKAYTFIFLALRRT